MNDYPLFTVGIVAFRNYQYLFRCLDSILMQTYPAIEIIVSNDGSDDFQINEIEKYIQTNQKENIQRFIVKNNNTRMGTVKNANQVFKMATGEFVKLIAADDALYHPKTLYDYYEVFMQGSDVGIVTGRCNAYDAFGEFVRQYPSSDYFRIIQNSTPLQLFNHMIYTNIIHTPGVCLRNSFYRKMGGFNERYKLIEDWPMWLKICRLGFKVYTTNEIVVRYHLGGVSNSSKNEEKIFRQECWADYFEIYKYEVMPYRNLITMNAYRKLKQAIRKLDLLYVRDFTFENMTFRQKAIYHIKKFLYSSGRASKYVIKNWLNNTRSFSKISYRLIFTLMSFIFAALAKDYSFNISNIMLVFGIIGCAYTGLSTLLCLALRMNSFYKNAKGKLQRL